MSDSVFGNARLEHHCRTVSEIVRYEMTEGGDLEFEREQLRLWVLSDAKAAMRGVAAELARMCIDGCKRYKADAEKFVERFPALSRMLPSGIVLGPNEGSITFRRDEYENFKRALDVRWRSASGRSKPSRRSAKPATIIVQEHEERQNARKQFDDGIREAGGTTADAPAGETAPTSTSSEPAAPAQGDAPTK